MRVPHVDLGARVLGFAFALALALMSASGAAATDGDLNDDGRIDAGDALIALRIAAGRSAPTPAQRLRGEVAPQRSSGTIGVADVLLIQRAARGEDLDGDGLSTATELQRGTSAFRHDEGGALESVVSGSQSDSAGEEPNAGGNGE